MGASASVTTANRPVWEVLRARQAKPDEILRAFEVLAPPVRVRMLAERMGVRVQEEVLQYAGRLDFDGGGQPFIVVNALDAHVRKRFTIAHEIGHLLLHRAKEQHRDTSFIGSPIEVAANRFAAALLMPAWMMENAIRQNGTDVGRLADVFEVSAQAIDIRLQMMSGTR